jgi:HlyD family secretion protein
MAKSSGIGGILITLLVLGGAGYGGYYFYSKKGSQEIEYSTTAVKRASVRQAITATGALQTVRQVDVSTLVSGEVIEVYKDFNDRVVKGDKLLQIDPAPYELKLRTAQANFDSNLASTTKSINDANRTIGLYKQKLVSEQEFDAANTSIAQANASRLTSQTSLDQAKLDLSRTTIVAPEDGIVLNRNVEKGKTVNSSQSSAALFTLVNDLTKLQVSADVSEADIGNAKEGQVVEFTVDAFQNRTFQGTVRQVRTAPKTSNSVVSYSCIIDVPNDDLSLRVGMTANLAIVIATRPTNTLVVPNSALRTKIPDEVQQEMAKRKAAGTPTTTAKAETAAAPAAQAQQGGARGAVDVANVDPAQFAGRGQGGPGGGQGGGGRGQGGGGRGGNGGGRGGRGGNVPAEATGVGANISMMPRTVYKLVSDAAGKKLPEAVTVRLGISDGTNTELTDAGGLAEGDLLVTFVTLPGTAAAQKAAQQAAAANPFGGQQQQGRGGVGGGGPGGGGGGGRGGF